MKGGNGSPAFRIGQSDMGGWVRVFLDEHHEPPTDLPVYLSQTLAEWFRAHPQFHLKCVVPVCRAGNTVELHGWYEVHLIAPTPLGPKPRDPP
jgi:hypothetical protein